MTGWVWNESLHVKNSKGGSKCSVRVVVGQGSSQAPGSPKAGSPWRSRKGGGGGGAGSGWENSLQGLRAGMDRAPLQHQASSGCIAWRVCLGSSGKGG